MNRVSKEVLFFFVALILFFLMVKGALRYIGNPDTGMVAVLAVIYSLFILGIMHLLKLQTTEGFWDVSPAAKCKGGPYMFQGDSPDAKMCRQMMQSEAGRCAIASYNCPVGYNGAPMSTFVYTPLSGDSWEDERCENKPTCKGCPYVAEQTMQSDWKYVD